MVYTRRMILEADSRGNLYYYYSEDSLDDRIAAIELIWE